MPASVVDSPVSAATGAVDSLKLIAGILGTLSVVGGVILAGFGLGPQVVLARCRRPPRQAGLETMRLRSKTLYRNRLLALAAGRT